MLGEDDVLDFPAQPLRHAASVSRVCSFKVPELAFLDVVRHVLHTGNNVADQSLTLVGLHEPKEVSRLRIVVIIQSMIVAVHLTGDDSRELSVGRILGWTLPDL